MTRTTRPAVTPRAGRGQDAPGALTLGALLDAERELTERVERARAKGHRLVESARAEVAAMESAASAELALALEALASNERAATERAVREIAATAASNAASFDATPDTVVVALAEEVLRDFLGTRTLGHGQAGP
jgi:vacuolar-type H+-ATPase subunit H